MPRTYEVADADAWLHHAFPAKVKSTPFAALWNRVAPPACCYVFDGAKLLAVIPITEWMKNHYVGDLHQIEIKFNAYIDQQLIELLLKR